VEPADELISSLDHFRTKL